MSGLSLTLTTAGRAALVNAQHNGTLPVTVATVGVTAATFPTDAASLKAMISLPGEIKRVVTISGGATASDTIHVTVNDSSSDTYSVLGLGLYLADGTMLGVYGQATAILQKSSQATMLLAFDVQFTDIAATSLAFGDTNFQLSQATTTQLGVVQLATDQQAIDGTDPSLAVVPHALKAALDDRLGGGAPTTFVKTLLAVATAAAFRTALALKSASTFDVGAGNGLDADKLDGQDGSFYQAWANLTGVPSSFPPSAHTQDISTINGLQAALNALAPLNAPQFTGVATVPTAAVGTNSTQIANTAYVVAAVNALINGAPGALDTLKELADAMGDDAHFSATVTNALAGKVAKAGDTMTGLLNLGAGVHVTGGQTVPNSQGSYLAWNKMNGWGDMSFINHHGGGSGGWTFWDTADGVNYTMPAYISQSGGFVGSTFQTQSGTIQTTGSEADIHFNFSGSGANGFYIAVNNAGFNVASKDANGGYQQSPLIVGRASSSYQVSMVGAVVANGGFQVGSDKHLKKNIVKRDVLRGIALRCAKAFSEWDLKMSGAHDVGLIAQTLRRFAPWYVRPGHFANGKDGPRMLSIDKAGVALECSMDNALAIEEILKRIAKLEKRK